MTTLAHNDIHHGTRKRYDKGCRCDLCREAAVSYAREYRKRKDPTAEGFAHHGAHFGYACGCRCNLCVSFKREYGRKIKTDVDVNAPDFKHGGHRGYALGCRCEKCRVAERKYRAKMAAQVDFSRPDFPHGERRGYRAGCRCELCVEASSQYQKAKNEARDKSDPNFPHGTPAGAKAGCMCEACREAKRGRERRYRREKYATDPIFAEKMRAWGRDHSKTAHSRALSCARVGKRNALKRTSVSSPDIIKLIYRHCPEGYHVDHIIPLAQGGAHAPENLQYLPATVNIRKKDRLDFDCSEHAIDWRLFVEPSTAISKESRGKRPEAPNIHGTKVDDDIACSASKGVAA